MNWRTTNNRKAKRDHSNALIVRVYRADGTLAQKGVSPCANAHERATFAWFMREATAATT